VPDEELERPDGAASARRVRRVRRRLLLPLVVAGAAVVVLSTALEGPAHVTPLGFGFAGSMPLAPRMARPAPPRPPSGPVDPAVSAAIGTILLVLASVVAAVVLVVLIRLLVLAIRRRRRRAGVAGLVTADAGAQGADAPAVRRGIAAALVAFEERGEPGDAVVRAWLGLQQAAEDAGFARSPAETPTEFTGRVLSRTGADRAALRTLLRLYLRARFGDGAITAADAAGARESLRALEASWGRGTTA
jgi:hypothetical protein